MYVSVGSLWCSHATTHKSEIEVTTRADLGGRTPYVVPFTLNEMLQSEQSGKIASILK